MKDDVVMELLKYYHHRVVPGYITGNILNLIENLKGIDTDNNYFIFIKEEDLKSFKSVASNFTYITCNVRTKLKRLIWEQLILHKYLNRNKIDILHSPHYTIPFIWKNGKRVVTFHDMTFFLLPEMHILHKRLIFKKIIPYSVFKADAVICVSENTAYDVS